ncbi:LysM peptidoglycan-binding domain-containing protein [Psychrobacillus sp. NPDC096623]|uniref:LysM peptidoglycan-binding domain-containing protein n=1 Tax=Psychrobacillus sp. NPDC096623 TaxID=3364492 RepID=UPI003805F639
MYFVQPCDHYWGIAQRFHITLENILAVNPGVNPYYHLVGQHNFIPVLQPPLQNPGQNECIHQG